MADVARNANDGEKDGSQPDQQTILQASHISPVLGTNNDDTKRGAGTTSELKPPIITQDHNGRVVSTDASAPFTLPTEIGTSQKGQAVRRIIAEDPEWNLAPVERLSDLCVKMIVAHFEKKPVLKGIPDKYRDRIIAAISIDIPLPIAAPLIPDESYWQRRSKTRFKLANVQEHGGSWKRLFFELHLRDRIENFVPVVDDVEKMQELLEEIKLGAPFVDTLHLRQLKPVETTHDTGNIVNDDLNASKKLAKEVVALGTGNQSNRIDLSVVLNQFVCLKDLNIYYGVRDCGINFSWSYFGMTLNDSLKLSESLKVLPLQRLVIHASAIDDDRCRLICHALLNNTTLTYLDLSHNKISDSGARGLAKVLVSPQINIKDLFISNNKISLIGAKSLGKALAINTSLQHLDLRLNHLGDAGGHAICVSLTKNKHLQNINLSGNALGNKAVSALCALLRKNGSSLVSLDISCNKLGNHGHSSATEAAVASTLAGGSILGTAASAAAPTTVNKDINLFGVTHGNIDGDLSGKMIFEAISQNKYVTKLDLRMTDLSPEYLVAIQGIVNENGLA